MYLVSVKYLYVYLICINIYLYVSEAESLFKDMRYNDLLQLLRIRTVGEESFI